VSILPCRPNLHARARHLVNQCTAATSQSRLDEELLDLVLEGLDLALELRSLVCGHGRGNHGAGHAAGTAEGLL
jgi:hypothetical protein